MCMNDHFGGVGVCEVVVFTVNFSGEKNARGVESNQKFVYSGSSLKPRLATFLSRNKCVFEAI